MRKPFMSLIANDRYQIGCTGQTVYLLDASGNELAKFKDMPYAYDPAFHPSGEIAAVYGNTGMMAVYALSERRLLAKISVSAARDGETLFLLGYFRKEDGNDYFVTQLLGESLQNVKPLDRHTYDFYQSAMRVKQAGFTREAFKWSALSFMPAEMGASHREYTLDDLIRMKPSLARLWEEI